MINKARRKLAGGGDGTVVLMIGLYLIILAFFILLNAISESNEANYNKASNSLKTAFGFTSGEIEKNKDPINISIEEFYNGIVKKITGILSSYFPAEEYDVNLRSGIMVITVPTKNFFDGNDITVNPMIYSFVYDLVDLINNLSGGSEIDVEVSILSLEQQSVLKNEKNLKKAALRASDISNIFYQEKSTEESLKTSVGLSEEDVVKIYLTVKIKDYQRAILSYKDFLQQ